MTDIYSLAIQVDSRDLVKGKQSLAEFASSAGTAGKSVDRLTVATQHTDDSAIRSTRGFSMMRGGVQQLGYQVQDVATQLSMGTNAMIVFGEQGSQIASIFGPGGALLGAVFAIAGALGGAFFRGTEQAKSGAKDLAQEIEDLDKKTQHYTQSQRAYMQQNLGKQIGTQTQRIAEAQTKLAAVNSQINDIIQRSQAGVAPKMTPFDTRQLNQLRDQQLKLNTIIDTAKQETAGYQKQIVDLNHSFDDNSKSTSKVRQQIDSLVHSLKFQAATISMTAEQESLYEAAQMGANKQDVLAIKNAYAKINAYKAQQTALKEAQSSMLQLAKGALSPFDTSNWQKDNSPKLAAQTTALKASLDQRFAIHQQYQQRVQTLQDAYDAGVIKSQSELNMWMVKAAASRDKQLQHLDSGRYKMLTKNQQSALSTLGDAMSNFASIAHEGGKKSFDDYKAFATAQASIAAALAINKALGDSAAPGPLAIAEAFSIGALAAVQIAKIQATQYTGTRAGGGQVLSGQSYLVGERGPEILTMGGNSGNITPNHKMGGNDVNVTNVLQVSAGVQGTVQAELRSMLPHIASISRQAVLEAINRGGTLSRAVNLRT